MTTNRTTLALLCLALTQSAMAAKPTAIRFISEIEQQKSIAKQYEVVCSDKRTLPILLTPSKDWCTEVDHQTICYSRKMKAAKMACK